MLRCPRHDGRSRRTRRSGGQRRRDCRSRRLRNIRRRISRRSSNGTSKRGTGSVNAGSQSRARKRSRPMRRSPSGDNPQRSSRTENGPTDRPPRPLATAARDHSLEPRDGVFRRRRPASVSSARPGSVAGADRKLDIFIPADRTLDAASRRHGARAAAKASRCSPAQSDRAKSSKCIERDTHQFVGTYFESAGNAYRASRWHRVQPAGAAGRSGREKCPARRQSRVRDDPLSRRTCTTAKA